MIDCKIIFVIIILYFLYLCLVKKEFYAFNGPGLVPKGSKSKTDWGYLNSLEPTYLTTSEQLNATYPDIVGSYSNYY